MFELKYFIIFLSFLVYGNLETCLQITNNNGNMGKHGIFLGFYYKRNAIYFGIGLSMIGLYYNSYILIALSIAILTFVVYKMLKQIYEYRNLFN